MKSRYFGGAGFTKESRSFYPKSEVDAKIKRLHCVLDDLEGWLDNECILLGAVDGYGYSSGVEYGLRKAAIEVQRRKRLI